MQFLRERVLTVLLARELRSEGFDGRLRGAEQVSQSIDLLEMVHVAQIVLLGVKLPVK